ncbi:unnamed protein product [Orchesella dallaii]|uniref:Uncharacterized protein n=1 Tax=Orchesella dallaii TaxID=48710 RepID=A0ABP1RI23_9HEXA
MVRAFLYIFLIEMDRHNVLPRIHPPQSPPPSSPAQLQPNTARRSAAALLSNLNNPHNSLQTPSQPRMKSGEVSTNSNFSVIAPPTPPVPVVPPPSHPHTLQQQQHMILPLGMPGPQVSLTYQPSTKENHGAAYEWMVKNLHEAAQQILNLETEVRSRDLALNSLKGIEIYLRNELGSIQQNLTTQEQLNEKLRGEVQSLKNITESHSQSVPKANYDEVLGQNKKIAENNAKLNSQNEELTKEVEQQKRRASDLGKQNGTLFGDSLVLQQDIVNLKEQLKQQQQKENKQKNKENEQNEKIKNLEAIIIEEQVKVKSLEEKLCCAKNHQETLVEQLEDKLSKTNAQILVLNDKLKTSSVNVDSFLVENQNLLKKIESFEAERKLYTNEKEQLNTKNSAEIQKLHENSRLLRTELQEKDECFIKLQSDFQELKSTSESECKRLHQQLDSESACVSQANIVANEQDEKIKSLTQQFEELKAKSKRKSEFIAALKNLVAKTEKDLKKANVFTNELKEEMDKLKIDKNYFSSQLNLKIAEIKKLQSESHPQPTVQVMENQLRKDIFYKNLMILNQQLNQQLEESSTLLSAREKELKQEKLATALQKDMINASDAKANELEEEVKALENKVENLDEIINKQENELQFLTRKLETQQFHLEVDQKQAQELQHNSQFAQNEALLEKVNEIRRLHETSTELKESLRKYKEESIENRKFIEKILAKKAQLKAEARNLSLPRPFETIEITCLDIEGNIIRKMPENDIHLRKLLTINTKKINYIARFLRGKLTELQDTNEGVLSLRVEINTLKKHLEEHKETINKLKRMLKENGMGHTDLCKELQRLRAEKGRLEKALNVQFTVEEEVICSSEDEESYESLAKKAKKSRIT